jgi:hypothetical protein
MLRPLLAMLLLAATPCGANDGFGGLSATGLTFAHTAGVAMESEDLFIGLDKIKVDYSFRNLTGHDVTGEVIFPLPPISPADLGNEDWNLPDQRDQPNLVNFTATVEGKPVAVAIDRVAVIASENLWEQPAAAAYDTPGRDVTDRLVAYGIPLSLDMDKLNATLAALPPATTAAMIAEGLVIPSGDTGAGDPTVYPLWSVVLRYHWTQTFPAGAVLHVSHAYDNRPPGGLFGWQAPPYEAYEQGIASEYCVDDGTSAAILKTIARKQDDGTIGYLGSSLQISYVLRTANSWAGPIGRFRLTVDKGSPQNVISLCADGVRKTGPTTFTVEKTNFAPGKDLDILIVQPPQN